ncbi:Bug family tripartite tricarboxylate transporter substrate binding protein [Comamonas sp. J-3]|uniref:Bug family tripartite tricarboxylate transporter substrate binding protein n=1 Tax=Comamonas trifloxystrobinivorans TaxID=3350256 RepID=UPI003727B886
MIHRVAVLALALGCVWGSIASAQPKSFPNQPIKLVVGYSPGGSVDIVARKYGQKLSELLGQSVVVENKAGASGTVAASFVKNAAPNGYTLYFVASPTISITPAVTATSFDPIKDFSPIGSVVKYTNVLLVGQQSPYKTLQQLVDFGKANPGQLTYASAGNGSSNHLSGVLLGKYAGLSMTHVPFKGNAPAMAELMANRVAILFDLNTTAVAQVQSGSVRALALTSPTRNKKLPDTPTMVEAGYPDFNFEGWIGLLAPAQTPPDVVDALAQANQKIVADASFVADMENSGYDLDPVSVAELKKRIAYDYEFFKKLAPDVQASQ